MKPKFTIHLQNKGSFVTNSYSVRLSMAIEFIDFHSNKRIMIPWTSIVYIESLDNS